MSAKIYCKNCDTKRLLRTQSSLVFIIGFSKLWSWGAAASLRLLCCQVSLEDGRVERGTTHDQFILSWIFSIQYLCLIYTRLNKYLWMNDSTLLQCLYQETMQYKYLSNYDTKKYHVFPGQLCLYQGHLRLGCKRIPFHMNFKKLSHKLIPTQVMKYGGQFQLNSWLYFTVKF